MDIAFLGMGLMGAPMAANCLKAGHRVTVWNRTAAKCEPLRALGAFVAATPAEAAQNSEAILLCVSDTPDVAAVLFGEQGVALGLAANNQTLKNNTQNIPALVIDHSTISPEAEAEHARRLGEACGALYLDAPVSGGDAGARAGTLSIMCGGPAEAFTRARPLLAAMGQTITHIGPRPGDGQRAKLVNQLVVALNCLATTEAMRFGEAMGLDMPAVLSAIAVGAAGSWSLSNLGPKFLARDFAPGFRLRHLLKDLRLCREVLTRLSPGGHLPAGGHPDPDGRYPGAALITRLVRESTAAGNGDSNINAVGKPFIE